MELYGYLTCEKSDEKLCILKELLKKKCVPVKFSTEQLQKVAKSLSEKRLSRWMQEEFQNITDLKPVTAMWLLASLDDLHGFEKEITKDKQVYFLLRDKELLSQCDSVSGFLLEIPKRRTDAHRRVSNGKSGTNPGISL